MRLRNQIPWVLLLLSLLAIYPKHSDAGIILHGDNAVVRASVLHTTHLCVMAGATGDSLIHLTSDDVILEADESCVAANCIVDSTDVAVGKTLTQVTNLVRSDGDNVDLVDADGGDYRLATAATGTWMGVRFGRDGAAYSNPPNIGAYAARRGGPAIWRGNGWLNGRYWSGDGWNGKPYWGEQQ